MGFDCSIELGRKKSGKPSKCCTSPGAPNIHHKDDEIKIPLFSIDIDLGVSSEGLLETSRSEPYSNATEFRLSLPFSSVHITEGSQWDTKL